MPQLARDLGELEPGEEGYPSRWTRSTCPSCVEETLELLDARRAAGLFVDATLGLGGHAEALLRRVRRSSSSASTAIPRRSSWRRGGWRLSATGCASSNANFHHLEQALAGIGITGGVAGILADLGVSSLQLDTPERGFSFRFDAPLDMRMGLAERTAADLVNEGSEGELEKIFREYGEERQARRIARAIVDARREQPIETTGQLKRLIDRVKGSRPHWDEGSGSIPRRASSRRCASRSTRSSPAWRGSSSRRSSCWRTTAGW